MSTATAASPSRRPWKPFVLGFVPFAAVIGLWWAAPHVLAYPAYVMPSVGEVAARLWEITASGQLARRSATEEGSASAGGRSRSCTASPKASAAASADGEKRSCNGFFGSAIGRP